MALTTGVLAARLEPRIKAALRAEFAAEAGLLGSPDAYDRLAAALAQGVAAGVVEVLTDPAVTQVVVTGGTGVIG